jgi:hypothetical protein
MPDPNVVRDLDTLKEFYIRNQEDSFIRQAKDLGVDIDEDEFELLLKAGGKLVVSNKQDADMGYVHRLNFSDENATYKFRTMTFGRI